MKKNRSYAIVGLGTFGSTVARELARFDNEVIGIDVSEPLVNAHAEDLGQALILDAREIGALREAGLESVDVGLAAIGTDIEASILSILNLKTIGIKTIWAKATSKNHHRILSKLGVDRVIHPEKEVGQHIAQVLHNPLVRDYVSLGNGKHVVNFRISASLQGKTLTQLPHGNKYNLRCIGVMRGSEFMGHDGTDCELHEDDLLLLLGACQDLREFAGSL
jgi:trk system potassium uptake protein TrkA